MKNLISICVILYTLTLFGCASMPVPVSVEDIKLTNTIMTTGGDGVRTKRKQQKGPFDIGDEIYMLSIVKWKDIEKGAGSHEVIWKWYSNDELITKVERRFNFYITPFELRGNIIATALGEGDHKVELYIDDKLFDVQKFSVSNEP